MPENKGTVLYVGGFELPDKNAAAHRVLNNAKILRELGYNVVFCGVDREISASAQSAEIISGFESYPVPYPKSTKQWLKQMLNIRQYSYLINKFSDIRIVICYNLHAAPLAKLIRLCRRNNIKIVADCTEWYENKFSFNLVKLIKCIDTFLCMRVFQKKCDGMIAISNYLAEYYKKSVKSIMVLPPLVDLSDEKFAFQTPKTENDIPTFVYSGSPSASKESLGDVVKCFDNITDLDYRLIIVGVTAEQFSAIYGFFPKSNKIEFRGRVPHQEALKAVRQSDYAIIIRPRTRVTMAGFPTKFAEAISVGTAVIANDTSDLSLYLKDGKNGHLADLASLENTLRSVISENKMPCVEQDIFNYKNYIKQFSVFSDKTFNS